MNILSFILGIGTVVVIVGIIVAVVSFFKVNKQGRKIDSLNESMSRRIDEIVEITNRQFEIEHRDRETVVDDIYRTIDSRLDKLENKLEAKAINNK